MTDALTYYADKTLPWIALSGKHRYRKELIYVGDFEKRTDGLEFSVSEQQLHQWVATFNEMKQNGIEVPVPLEHTSDPEKRRGTLVGLDVAHNSRSIPALFGEFEFVDEQAAQLTRSADVSIFVPPTFVDGKGVEYKHPIRHVALTDYPVVPQLDGFNVIAASHVTKGGDSMALGKSLAKLLEVEIGEDMDDAAIDKAVTTAVRNLKKLAAKAAKLDDPPDPKPKPDPEPKPISAGFISMARDNRTAKLHKLVKEHRITKAVKDDLEKQYCSDDALQLALSHDGTASDDFDNVVSALAKNEPIAKPETGAQVLQLGEKLTDADENPMLKDANRRAAAAGN